MFRDVPECSGMFQKVPCSWFIDGPLYVIRALKNIPRYHILNFSIISKIITLRVDSFNHPRKKRGAEIILDVDMWTAL